MKAEGSGVRDVTALLRRFEPVIRSTRGDRFYPMDVETVRAKLQPVGAEAWPGGRVRGA